LSKFKNVQESKWSDKMKGSKATEYLKEKHFPREEVENI
jgi:hypothetical protein